MPVTAIIPHYYTQRRPNLPVVVEALRSGSLPVTKILIWNNDPKPLTVKGAEVVQSPCNMGARARFIAALMTQKRYVFFQDNDLAVQRETVENLVGWAERLPRSVVSLDGRLLRAVDGSYIHSILLGPGVVGSPRAVDVTLGHAEMIMTSLLPQVLKHFPFCEAPVMDDIWFSWACEQEQILRRVIPNGTGSAFRTLKEWNVGARMEKKHYRNRDELCRKLFGRGG